MLLVVFLFNVGGYYIVFWGLRYHANKVLVNRLDNNQYLHEETVELKIPVTLPYPLQSDDFERVHGKFEHDGEFYTLVKQKLANDTLYVICIKDHHEKRLVKTMTDYFKLSNDLPLNSKHATTFLGKLIKDFETFRGLTLERSCGWCAEQVFTESSSLLPERSISVIAPPPKG